MNTVTLSTWLVEQIKAIESFEGGVFPDAAPREESNPCVIYQHIDFAPERNLEIGAQDTGLHIYQVRCYGNTRLEADTLRESMRQLFDGKARTETEFGILDSEFELQAHDHDLTTGDYAATGILTIFVH